MGSGAQKGELDDEISMIVVHFDARYERYDGYGLQPYFALEVIL